MKNPLLEFYRDYLINSFALINATGLSLLLDNEYSHDQITRFLSSDEYTSRDLWVLSSRPSAPSKRTTVRLSSTTPSRKSPTAMKTK